jgi:aminoglycoside phosphotransferase (APT) family kinase protein
MTPSSAEAAREIVWTFARRDAEALLPLPGGFANALFRAQLTDGSSVVVRLHTRDPERAAIEDAVLRRVAGIVPVPEVLWTDPTGAVAGVPASIHSWVDGILLDRVLEDGAPADLHAAGVAVGRTLAAIGSISFDTPGFFASPALDPTSGPDLGPDGLREYVRARLDAGTVLDRTTARSWWCLVDAAADVLTEVKGSRQLVHADFNGKNLMMWWRGPRWAVAAVLDWEFAFAGSPLVDIGNALRFEDDLPPQHREAFLAAYAESGGELPEEWRRISKALDAFALVDFLSPTAVPSLQRRMLKLVHASIERGEL